MKLVTQDGLIGDEFFHSVTSFSKQSAICTINNLRYTVTQAVGLTPSVFLRIETSGGVLLHHDVYSHDGGLFGQFYGTGHSSRSECGICSNTSHEHHVCVYDGEQKLLL